MPHLHTEFLTGRAGPCHVTAFRPDGPVTAAVVVAQPFAEEANKARRMIALLGRRLARDGVAVYVPDGYGCGDSGGDFAEARWPVWRDDLADQVARVIASDQVPVTLLGVRLGAPLVAAALPALPAVQRVVFWQPVVNGTQALTQFLRLRTAAAMMSDRRETVGELRQRISDGESLEVAGYTLNAELAVAVDDARLTPTSRGDGASAHWFWLTDGPEAPPPVQQSAQTWREAGWSVTVAPVAGDAFWATQEIALAPALLDATVTAVSGPAA